MRFSNDIVWLNNSASSCKTALLLEMVNEILLHKVLAKSPQKVFALDKAFNGDDVLKANAALCNTRMQAWRLKYFEACLKIDFGASR